MSHSRMCCVNYKLTFYRVVQDVRGSCGLYSRDACCKTQIQRFQSRQHSLTASCCRRCVCVRPARDDLQITFSAHEVRGGIRRETTAFVADRSVKVLWFSPRQSWLTFGLGRVGLVLVPFTLFPVGSQVCLCVVSSIVLAHKNFRVAGALFVSGCGTSCMGPLVFSTRGRTFLADEVLRKATTTNTGRLDSFRARDTERVVRRALLFNV